MKRFINRLFLLSMLILASVSALADSWSPQQIEDLKRTIVNIDVQCPLGLCSDEPGAWSGTGFIVDLAHGIVVTNQHITSESPVFITLYFIDGNSTDGTLIYYDYWHDFAFVKFDPTTVDTRAVKEAMFGSSFDLKAQDSLLLIGNNENEAYSVKTGRLVNPYLQKGDHHSATLQTSFDRTGGSSGSPVWNTKGEVVGIHFSGTDTSSFELRIEYIKDALRQLLIGKTPTRGDIGVQLSLINLSDAESHLHINTSELIHIFGKIPESHKILMVASITPHSAAENVFKASDIILSVSDTAVLDNLYLFDKLVDTAVGTSVMVKVLRGKNVIEAKLRVNDLENEKIKRFAKVSGATFQNLTQKIRWLWNCSSEGVVMNYAERGSPFYYSGIGSRDNPQMKHVLVTEMNGQPTKNLNDFIEIVKNLKDKEKTAILIQDFNDLNCVERVYFVIIDLTYSPLEIFSFDLEQCVWLSEK